MTPAGDPPVAVDAGRRIRTLRRLFAHIRRQHLHLGAVVALAVVGVTFSIVGPRLLGTATDRVVDEVTGGGPVRFEGLHRLLVGVLCLYVLSQAAAYASSWMLAALVQRTVHELRQDVESKLHRLPLAYLDRVPRGELLGRVTSDIDNLGLSLQQTLSQLLIQMLALVGVAAMMLALSPALALIAVGSIPLSVLLLREVSRRARARFALQWQATGALNAEVEQTVSGHDEVIAFGREEDVVRRFELANESLDVAGRRAQFLGGAVQPAMTLLGNLGFVAAAVLGGFRIASGSMTVGELQAFLQYLRQFSMPLAYVGSMVSLLQSGIASAERVFELLDQPEEPPDGHAAPMLRRPRGRVRFEHVSFSYEPPRPVIEDLSLDVAAGSTVAIVGPTGAGKTTVVNLLMRFYDVTSGRILLDGDDISTMRRRDLRRVTGMVLQDTWLVGDTVRANIAYSRPSATDEEIEAAAIAARLDHVVRALPRGYDTLVGDDLGNLSAGERQLVTIARAFLADPIILILDEATSAVDTRTEVLIQQATAALRADRTCFIIAHRLSTVRDADVILVMDRGRIIEQGTHGQLLACDGAYASLHRAQFGASP